MSLEEVRKRDGSLGLRVRVRNAVEYGAAAGAVYVFGRMTVEAHGTITTRIGCALSAAGVMYVVVRLHRDGAASAPPPPGSPATEVVAHYRASLVRQRDLLAGVWRGYLGPLVPGLVTLAVGFAFEAPFPAGVPAVLRLAIAAIGLAWSAVVFALIAWMNKRGARKLERLVQALDA